MFSTMNPKSYRKQSSPPCVIGPLLDNIHCASIGGGSEEIADSVSCEVGKKFSVTKDTKINFDLKFLFKPQSLSLRSKLAI